MIVYDLRCDLGHGFEAWFANAAAYAAQNQAGQVVCPYCESSAVSKAVMAPRIAKGSGALGPEAVAALAAMQREMLKGSTWVGDRFAPVSRAMAEGETPHATIHGRATIEEVKALHDDGIKTMPLPFPIVPPDKQN